MIPSKHSTGWFLDTSKLVLLPVLLCLSIVVARSGIADYHADSAYRIMRSWDEREPDAIGPIDQARALMDRALDLDPREPTYLHRAGRLFHIRMLFEGRARILLALGDAPALGNSAAASMRGSLDVRPLWPLSWSGLALIKRDRREFDDELEHAVLSASRFGQWEPGVLEQITAVGLPSWSNLSEKERAAVVGNVQRGLRSSVGGTAQSTVRALRAVGAPGSDLVQALGPALADAEWPDRALAPMAEVALWLWPRWTPGVRQILAERVTDAALRDNRGEVLWLITQNKLLEEFCPRFPDSLRFRAYCDANPG